MKKTMFCSTVFAIFISLIPTLGFTKSVEEYEQRFQKCCDFRAEHEQRRCLYELDQSIEWGQRDILRAEVLQEKKSNLNGYIYKPVGVLLGCISLVSLYAAIISNFHPIIRCAYYVPMGISFVFVMSESGNIIEMVQSDYNKYFNDYEQYRKKCELAQRVDPEKYKNGSEKYKKLSELREKIEGEEIRKHLKNYNE